MLELLAAVITAAASCALPAGLMPAPVLAQEEQRLLPTTQLVLAYYWWPQECRRTDLAESPGCAAGFGFRVHGLWPDAAKGTWPQFCRPPTAIDMATLRASYCTTPAPVLMQHEWAKHGTCGWPTAAAYFAQMRGIAASIDLPDVDRLKTAGEVRDAFLAANPRLPRTSLFVGLDRDRWLTEVRVCLTRRATPAPCADGRIGLDDAASLRVWPR